MPIPPGLLLAIVLPGLVFEAAFRTDPAMLRPTAAVVFILAIPGVVLVAAIVAVVLAATTELTTTEGFLVGAMVAATDPAAVLSTFRRIRVPDRLATMVEMESLVNDGTGIVLFAVAVDVLAGDGSIDLGGSAVSFVLRVVGGAALGAGLGWLGGRLSGKVDDHLTELTVTVVLAYGTYLLAEALGVSGVIATLVAASTLGATAGERLTLEAREAIDIVWEFAAFLLTAGVFVLVGVSIAPDALVHAAGAIGWGIAGVLVARAVVVFGIVGGGAAAIRAARRGESSRTSEPLLPGRWLPVLFWAGLRGAVSVALALSIPASVPHRDVIQGITFGIVLFTLIVQGATTGWVVRRSGVAIEA